MCKNSLNPYQIRSFSFHRLLVENLWKIVSSEENHSGWLFSTIVHNTSKTALAEKWKNRSQITNIKRLMVILSSNIMWKQKTLTS